jgi:sRNA-binding carbon storage regulator CsrA
MGSVSTDPNVSLVQQSTMFHFGNDTSGQKLCNEFQRDFNVNPDSPPARISLHWRQLTILGIQGQQLRLGLVAPREVVIDRSEVHQRKLREASATEQSPAPSDSATPRRTTPLAHRRSPRHPSIRSRPRPGSRSRASESPFISGSVGNLAARFPTGYRSSRLSLALHAVEKACRDLFPRDSSSGQRDMLCRDGGTGTEARARLTQ